MLELWELGGQDDSRFSTYSWRTRLALHHKGLAFTVHPVSVSDNSQVVHRLIGRPNRWRGQSLQCLDQPARARRRGDLR